MFIREARQIVRGKMTVIRFGSCGTIRPDVPVGSVVVQAESVLVSKCYDAFHSTTIVPSSESLYSISEPVSSTDRLTRSLRKRLEDIGKDRVITGINASADSFYCTQGRHDPSFHDGNEDLLRRLQEWRPKGREQSSGKALLFFCGFKIFRV
jgi:uridine phosphorylase